jgi:hypothetical protein
MPAPAGMRAVDGHNPAPRRRHLCTGVATRRCADGGSPSGVSTADDRRRLAVPPIIGHNSPRGTAAEGSGAAEDAGRGVSGVPWRGSAFTRGCGFLHNLTAAAFGIPHRGHLRLSGFARPGSRRQCAVSRARPQQVASPTATRFFAAGLSSSVRGFVDTTATSCEPYG